MNKEEKANIKYRLSDLGVQVGELALEYILELEKENEQLKQQIENYQLAENESKEIIAELKAQNKTILEDNDTLNKWVDERSEQIEKLLQICKDKGIISSWYFNGAYHWELDDFNILYEQVRYRNQLILNSYRIDNLQKLREVLQNEKWRKKLGKKFCKDLDEVYAKHMRYKLTN